MNNFTATSLASKNLKENDADKDLKDLKGLKVSN